MLSECISKISIIKPEHVEITNHTIRDTTADLLRGLPVIVTNHRGSSAFSISPVQGEDELQPVVNYTYDLEKITPYSYTVYLDEAQLLVNFAPSHQLAVYDITFEKEGDNFIVVNTRNGAIQNTDNGVRLSDDRSR